jgi:formamidopyrimidine-DNA glycosylase
MPELPEVEQAARTLGEQVVGATFDGTVRCSWLRTIDSHAPDVIGARLMDVQITGWRRRAKWILLPLSSADTFVAHLRMTGRFVVCQRDDADISQQRVAFGLHDGREIRFVDQRKFGRIFVMDPGQLAALNAAHGPEPLDDVLTPAQFFMRLQQTQRAIKPVLLDQRVIAGVGNIYADEALWRAHIHPLTPANRLTFAQVELLLQAIRTVLHQALTNGGSTLRDYRESYGAKGTQQDNFQAYDRTGQPCYRCGTPIVKTVVAQRGTHLCLTCQPLP